MARFRKVDTRIWNDEVFRSFSDNGKLLFFFLLTHPNMTSLGAMRASLPGLAAELGWSEESLRQALGEALSKGRVKVDERASCVMIPNFLRYNSPENPNVLKAWQGALDLIPECDLKTQVIEIARVKAESLSEAFREALPEAFRKPFRIPEPEPEQEKKRKKNFSFLEKRGEVQGVASPQERKRQLEQNEKRRIADLDAKAYHYLRSKKAIQ